MLRGALAVSATFTALAGAPAYGGWTVTQSLLGKNGATPASTFTWSIDEDKFALEMKTSAATTIYLFNGKTFYVCGKIDDAQLKAANADPSVMAAYKDGICQVAPSNFMTRFFLSPIVAVASVDASDGMRLTLTLQDYQRTIASTASAASHACKTVKRSYTFTKSGEQATPAGDALNTQASETLCSADDLPWRQGLWKEVQKTLLRQPGGIALIKDLKSDLAEAGGLALAGDVTQSLKDRGGKARDGAFELSTSEIRSGAVDAEKFKLPAGYQVFAVESLDLAKLSGPDTKKLRPGDKDEALDTFRAVVLCALTQRLGCFSK